MPKKRKKGARLVDWRRLDDDDIRYVLEATPLQCAIDPGALRHEINNGIAELDDIVAAKRVEETTHEKLKKLRQLRRSLVHTLKCLGGLGAIQQCAVSRTCDQLSRDDLDAYEISTRFARPDQQLRGFEFKFGPNLYWVRTGPGLSQVIDGLKLLRLAIAAYETTLEQRQAAANSKSAPNQPNYVKYALIATLANIFESSFKIRASQYDEGPWCKFLAAVLSRCEKQIDEAGALGLWKDLCNDERLRDGGAHRYCAHYAVGQIQKEDVPPDFAARIAVEDAKITGLAWWPTGEPVPRFLGPPAPSDAKLP